MAALRFPGPMQRIRTGRDAYISTPKTTAAYRTVALPDRAIAIVKELQKGNEIYKKQYC